ncbi:Fe2+-dependent dioxygenase, partial [Sphingomonas sp.]|jgi:PKHD-type hydroxylase|uniref:Fe2+-dependent dioxygenase n=1 Tax=Sphingomonas sp. TaxID=28214 RepID=UPI00262F320A
MIVQADILSRDEVLAIRKGLDTAPFHDGRVTAGKLAGTVKDNEQARGDDPNVIALARRIRLAMETHPTVRTWARPLRWSNLMFSRYRTGQQYGLHTDNAVIADEHGWPLRTDISFTVFLSDLGSYDGGQLLVRECGGDRSFRLQAGSVIFYPADQIHAVQPITRGTRLACVGWIQSVVRHSDQRKLICDLDQVRSGTSSDDASLILDKAIANLLRMWGEH